MKISNYITASSLFAKLLAYIKVTVRNTNSSPQQQDKIQQI